MTISQVLEEFALSLTIEGVQATEIYIELPKQARDRLDLEFAHQMSEGKNLPTNETKNNITAYHSYSGFVFRFSK